MNEASVLKDRLISVMKRYVDSEGEVAFYI